MFPGGVAGGDLVEYVGGADAQEICVRVWQTLDEAVFDQVRVDVPQVGRGAIVIHRDDLARLEIEAGIHIKPRGIFEQLREPPSRPPSSLL